jgi:hypothetical protein
MTTRSQASQDRPSVSGFGKINDGNESNGGRGCTCHLRLGIRRRWRTETAVSIACLELSAMPRVRPSGDRGTVRMRQCSPGEGNRGRVSQRIALGDLRGPTLSDCDADDHSVRLFVSFARRLAFRHHFCTKPPIEVSHLYFDSAGSLAKYRPLA